MFQKTGAFPEPFCSPELCHNNEKYRLDPALTRGFRFRQLLWTSDAGVPDLGGVAEEEEASFADEVQQPELKFPGAYRSITIEINVRPFPSFVSFLKMKDQRMLRKAKVLENEPLL